MPVTLQDLGWNDHFQNAFDAIAKSGWIPGRLIRETKINFTALLDGGEDIDVVVSGKLWHDAATDAELPAVGDWVAIAPGEAEDEAVIRAILPRQTCFSRKAPGKSSAEQVLGANVDIVAVVTEPGTDFNPRRMERYFTLIRRSGAMPLILLNKVDLFSRKEVEEATHILRELCPECGIICISALRNKGINGAEAQEALDRVGITVNKNAIPFDTGSPMKPSGIRIGTPAVTTRGMKEQDVEQVAEFIARALALHVGEQVCPNPEGFNQLKKEVSAFNRNFRLPH